MHPRLKAMGYEEVAFIPDPEAGLKEGEEPPPLPTIEEADPDILKYRPYPEHQSLKLHPAMREAAAKYPGTFVAEFVASFDRLQAPRD
jgi:hypothetical protein